MHATRVSDCSPFSSPPANRDLRSREEAEGVAAGAGAPEERPTAGRREAMNALRSREGTFWKNVGPGVSIHWRKGADSRCVEFGTFVNMVAEVRRLGHGLPSYHVVVRNVSPAPGEW
ncbi:hypothetical protein Vretifemale_20858 [Volvox reticuliferus]|uniref:Uncharacterized protein n=1 Tax=Volvox reticuliferus TaxID=1737510 RepID=A0A8J4D5R6_9CHLO|nr:hypothetical protein Vretifemale_20858 [Volvox reticuliferus]